MSNRWVPYIGDCKALDSYLNSGSGVLWILPKYLNALFRGVSQVVLANNPVTGLLILVALTWADLVVGLATVVAASSAIITALVMQQDWTTIQAGLTTYNSVLVGSITASLWTPLYDKPLSPKLWGFIVVGSVLSVFINSGLGNILSKLSLPKLTLPFNVVILLLFTCLMPPLVPNPTPTNSSLAPAQPSAISTGLASRSFNFSATGPPSFSKEVDTDSPGTHRKREWGWVESKKVGRDRKVPAPARGNSTLIWGEIWSGIILSMGQVFGVESVLGSVLIYIAIMIFSPLLCLMCLIGACIGTLAGIVFTTEPPYTAVYTGIWGYNGILSAGAVGGFFFVITLHSFMTAVMNVVFTALIQQGLVLAFRGIRLPVFTLPFVLSTLLFLAVTSTGSNLTRVTNISFPEMHFYEYIERRRLAKQSRKEKQSTDINEESGGVQEVAGSESGK